MGDFIVELSSANKPIQHGSGILTGSRFLEPATAAFAGIGNPDSTKPLQRRGVMPNNSVVTRPPPNERPKNRLLRSLPPEDFARLLPHLKTISVDARHVFHKYGEPLEYVYFPNGGVASVTALLGDGTMVETATVGVEGIVGLEAFLGARPVAVGETMMQVPDTSAERLEVSAFRRELARQGVLFDLMGRYAQAARCLHDAVGRVQRETPHPGAMLEMAADDTRQSRPRRVRSESRVPRRDARRPPANRHCDRRRSAERRNDQLTSTVTSR